MQPINAHLIVAQVIVGVSWGIVASAEIDSILGLLYIWV